LTTKSSGIQAHFKLSHPGFSLDVALDLPGRGTTALFGPSGSGKTSCLRVIAGLARSDVAHRSIVQVNGAVWQNDDARLWVPVHQRALGYVFQDAKLFPHLSVAQNIGFGIARIPEKDRRVSLEQAVTLLGLGSLMDRAPDTLSGGERQRVAIARALATSPSLLLMDEPLAALDARRKGEILPYLETLNTELNIPILYVSHAIDEVARLADHLVLLEAGRVVATGPTHELLVRLDLPLAHGDTAGAVITATVESHHPDDHLTTVQFEGGALLIPQQSAGTGQTLRLRVQARDVSLTLSHQSGSSILNILPATVTALSTDSPGQTMVSLDVGGTPLLARITQRSAKALDLKPGLRLFAQIKGAAILG
jgi:molybdate transport system ATP-binding protein